MGGAKPVTCGELSNATIARLALLIGASWSISACSARTRHGVAYGGGGTMAQNELAACEPGPSATQVAPEFCTTATTLTGKPLGSRAGGHTWPVSAMIPSGGGPASSVPSSTC